MSYEERCELINAKILQLIRARTNSIEAGYDIQPTGTYIIEECSELIKELTKEARGKGNLIHIIEEMGDVLMDMMIYLVEHKLDFNYKMIEWKLDRAIYEEASRIN